MRLVADDRKQGTAQLGNRNSLKYKSRIKRHIPHNASEYGEHHRSVSGCRGPAHTAPISLVSPHSSALLRRCKAIEMGLLLTIHNSSIAQVGHPQIRRAAKGMSVARESYERSKRHLKVPGSPLQCHCLVGWPNKILVCSSPFPRPRIRRMSQNWRYRLGRKSGNRDWC